MGAGHGNVSSNVSVGTVVVAQVGGGGVCKRRSNSSTRAGRARRAVAEVAEYSVTTAALASGMPLRRHTLW